MKWIKACSGFGLAAALLLTGCTTEKSEPAQKPESQAKPVEHDYATLSIVGIGDVHGHVEQMAQLGGYLNALRGQRNREGGKVLVLDSGDIFQGTLESNLGEGAAMVHAYRALKVKAAALGNHEFDFGPVGPNATPKGKDENPRGALEARAKEASFTFLAANLYKQGADPATDTGPVPIEGVKRSMQVTVVGINVGIIGGMTEEALSMTHADNVRDLQVGPLAPALAREAAALRAKGSQVIVALVHAGGDCKDLKHPDDVTSCNDGEVFKVARALPEHSVDVIVAGHTHSGIAQRVNGVAIIQSFANGHAFGRVDVRFDRTTQKVERVDIKPPQELCLMGLDGKPASDAKCPKGSKYEGRLVLPDPAVRKAVKADIEAAKSKRDEALGVTLAKPINRVLTEESPLGNLAADVLLRAVPRADAAFNNGGSLRANLPAGPLTYGQAFELFPFDNKLTTLKMRGKDLARVVQNSLAGERGVISLAGLTAKASCENGELKVSLLRANGTPVADDAKLTVVTSDYVAKAGDGLLKGVQLTAADMSVQDDKLVRDVLIAGLKHTPAAGLDPNNKKLFDAEHPRLSYPGKRPVKCGAAPAAAGEKPSEPAAKNP